MGSSNTKPLFLVEIKEEYDKDKKKIYISKESFLEYLESGNEKTFSKFKDEIYKNYGYHKCIQKICYYNDKNQIIEYEDANKPKSHLKLKDSLFKTTETTETKKIKNKSIIIVVIINGGVCRCEELIREKFEEEKKKYMKEHKELLEKLEKQKDVMIQKLQIQNQTNNIQFKREIEKLNQQNLETQKKFEENLKQLIEFQKENKEKNQENPKNEQSLKIFGLNKPQINNNIIKKAKNEMNTMFDFRNFEDSYRKNINKFHEMIHLLFNKINYENYLVEKILKMLKDKPLNKNGKSPIEHFNILVLGPSGVGKSTLINSMLLLDENKDGAKTAVGAACTKGPPQEYTSNKIQGIRLYDTQGIELGDYNIVKVQKDATDLINKKINSGDPDQYIHCIWYCVSDTRFQIEEQNCLSVLMNSYNNNIIPIIIVYGKAADEELKNKMINEINKFCIKYEKQELTVIPILAKKYAERKPYGKNKLLKITVDKLKNALESSCYEGLRKEEFKKFHNDFYNKLKETEKKSSNNSKDISKEIITKNFTDKINKILNKNISKDDLNQLIIYLSNFYNNLTEEFDKKMDYFCSYYGQKLFNDYFNEYIKLDKEYGSEIIKTLKPELINILKDEIENELKNEIKNSLFPKIYIDFEKFLLDELYKKIDEKFNEIILKNSKIIKELQIQVDSIVKISYNSIYNKIKKCINNNSNNLDFYEEETEDNKNESKNELNGAFSSSLDDIDI